LACNNFALFYVAWSAASLITLALAYGFGLAENAIFNTYSITSVVFWGISLVACAFSLLLSPAAIVYFALVKTPLGLVAPIAYAFVVAHILCGAYSLFDCVLVVVALASQLTLLRRLQTEFATPAAKVLGCGASHQIALTQLDSEALERVNTNE
jgi:hypothetical protein